MKLVLVIIVPVLLLVVKLVRGHKFILYKLTSPKHSYNNNNNNIISMALKSSEARAQKRNKTKSVIIFKSRGGGGHTGVIISFKGPPGDVRKVQETSQIRLLMYCKSMICKSGQFEFDSVINWKPVYYPSSCLSRGSDGEKRGALSTTCAR